MTTRTTMSCGHASGVLLLALCACDSRPAARAPEVPREPQVQEQTNLHLERAQPAPGLASDVHLCERVCAHTAALACSAQAECLSACVEMHKSVQACAPKLDGFMRCLVALPLSEFECDDEGIASVKGGRCEQEQATVAQCLVSTPADG